MFLVGAKFSAAFDDAAPCSRTASSTYRFKEKSVMHLSWLLTLLDVGEQSSVETNCDH